MMAIPIIILGKVTGCIDFGHFWWSDDEGFESMYIVFCIRWWRGWYYCLFSLFSCVLAALCWVDGWIFGGWDTNKGIFSEGENIRRSHIAYNSRILSISSPTNICIEIRFSLGGKDYHMLSLTYAYYLYPLHPMHSNQTYHFTPKLYPPGKMQKNPSRKDDVEAFCIH